MTGGAGEGGSAPAAGRMAATEPFADMARAAAERFRGEAAQSVGRFTTGAANVVFEVTFVRAPPLVVRMARPQFRAACAGGAVLSRRLRPLGVPLPRLLHDGSGEPTPYLLLERLPGADLGRVVAGLSDASLRHVARCVVSAQRIVAGLPAAGRYGYAVEPDRAPHSSWSEVLRAHLRRSRDRIAAAGLFDPGVAAAAGGLIDACAEALARVPPTPFLHDTTLKNVIVTAEGEVSGIVDVDDLCFGDPRYVVALTTTALMNQAGSLRYVDHWLAEAGSARDRLFWLYVALFVVDFMSEHGQPSNGNETPSLPADRERLQAMLAQVSARVV